jgi:hypothetical protein
MGLAYVVYIPKYLGKTKNIIDLYYEKKFRY